ncbi:MAG: hypothetical protein ABMB14_05155 [Myxococcota bacterium]
MTPAVRALRERFARYDLLDPPQARAFADRRAESSLGRPRLPGPAHGWPIRVVRPPVLDAEDGIRAGEAVAVLVDPVPDPEARVVVVMRRRAGRWRLETPLSDEDAVSPALFDRTDDGAYRIELCAGSVGRERIAIALVPRALVPTDGSPAERCTTIIERIVERVLPVGVMDLDILS